MERLSIWSAVIRRRNMLHPQTLGIDDSRHLRNLRPCIGLSHLCTKPYWRSRSLGISRYPHDHSRVKFSTHHAGRPRGSSELQYIGKLGFSILPGHPPPAKNTPTPIYKYSIKYGKSKSRIFFSEGRIRIRL